MKHNIKKSFSIKVLQSLLIAVCLSPVYGDDTEIFYTENEINNNILFIMDNSGSMTNTVPGTRVNNGDDFKRTSTVNHVRDDTQEGNYSNFNFWGAVSSYQIENGGGWWPAYLALIPEYNRPFRKTTHDRQYLDLGELHSDTLDHTFGTKVALRFQNIQVPQGREITGAYIQFTASSDESRVNSDPANFVVRVQNTNNSGRMGTWTQAIRSRNWFGGVNWNPSAWDAPNASSEAQKTSNLKNLVQQVVNRGGWSEGNAIQFMIEGNGKRVAQAFDFNGEEGAPVLTITYAAGDEEKTRLQVMQDALKIVLAEAPSNLSVGLMHYGDSWRWRKNYPNGVSFPVTALDTLAKPIIEDSIKIDGVPNWRLNTLPVPDDIVTVRTYLSEIVDSWGARGNTPIVESIYEASRYFRGKRSAYGNYQASSWYAAHPSTYARPEPDLFEAMRSNYDVSLCTATPNSQQVWNGSIARWRNGNAWEVCPADPSNPTGPGTKENCALPGNEYDCDRGQPYDACVNWIDETTHQECTGTVADENEVCTTVVDDEGYCENEEYVERTDEWCWYKTCKNENVRNNIAEYITPTVADCQSNNIILMSDGKPEIRDINGVELFPGQLSGIRAYMGSPGCDLEPFGFKSGRCGAELTHHLATNDINPGISGDQLIDTYVIGFSSGITVEAEGYLKSLVTIEDDPDTADKEGYFSAQNEEALAAAFRQTLEEIAEEARSQASPGYSVNVKSGLEHEDAIFIPVFDKSSGSRWSGNLKKFKLVEDGDQRYIRGKVTKEGDSDATGYINAMTELGLFKDDAWDEWSKSEVPDGNDVEKGGTASLLTDPRVRKLYSNLASNDLSEEDNHITPTNSNLEQSMLFKRSDLGLDDEAAAEYRWKLINFIRGWTQGEAGGWQAGASGSHPFPEDEIPNHARKHMGDMLHSEPVVITYKQGDDDGIGKEKYIFAATNEGYLHVFDSETGEEKFAFMPKELLKNIHGQYTNEGEHVYGVDGNISFFIKNDNHNGVVDSGEEVWLYFGLRRGGTSYYALDVTDIDNPKLKWVVKGGDTGFEHLNQSWSAPYIANSKVDGVKKPVVIFTGGNDSENMDYGSGDSYDPTSVKGDNGTTSANGVYIVDADDGTKLWDIMEDVSDAESKLTHGIPGGVRILDVNRNGYLDRLYFADTGGFVWRLDLDESLGSGSVLTKFADLGGTDKRKFYNEPDVAILSAGVGKRIFSVSVGSGLRPHPMNEEISDHMFVLLDNSPFKRLPDDFETITIEGDAGNGIPGLESVTITDEKVVNHSNDFQDKKITQTGSRGWYVIFGQSGEKVLATSITFEGSIIFTTLVPKALDADLDPLINACAAPSTQGRLYAMDLLTGEASMDLDNSGDEPNDNDVFATISGSEIPGTPQRIFNGLECSNGSCVHDVDVRVGKKSSQVGTTNVQSIESAYWNTPEAVQ